VAVGGIREGVLAAEAQEAEGVEAPVEELEGAGAEGGARPRKDARGDDGLELVEGVVGREGVGADDEAGGEDPGEGEARLPPAAEEAGKASLPAGARSPKPSSSRITARDTACSPLAQEGTQTRTLG
jgi:hypothetical protein